MEARGLRAGLLAKIQVTDVSQVHTVNNAGLKIEALLWLQPPEHRDYGSEPAHPCEGPGAHSLKTASSRNQFKLSLSFSFPVKAAFSATQAAEGENVVMQAYSQSC